MPGRRLDIAWNETIEQLADRLAVEREPRRRERLQVLLFVRLGMRLNEACAMVGVNYRSAVRWLRWYRREGLESMLRRTPGRATTGRRPKLTSQQSSALVERYEAGQLRTLREAVAWAREQFGVAYSPSGMCILLRRERARLGHVE